MLAGKLYVLGGNNGGGEDLSIVESYDPATDHWVTASPMPTARSGLAATAVQGKLYAIGGSKNGTPLATVEAFTLFP